VDGQAGGEFRIARQRRRRLHCSMVWFRCLIRAGVPLVGLLVGGCDRPTVPRAAPSRTNASIEAREAELDRTVWKNEVLAQQFEKTFVKLSDDVRRADDKLAVLSRFPFESVRLPKAIATATKLILGIERQGFNPGDTFTLSHADWERRIGQLQKAGWSIVQCEWHQERFVPGTGTNDPISEFSFEIDGQKGESNRFILRGVLRVQWPQPVAGLAAPRQLQVSDLVLLEREGPPGFSNHLLLAPEPVDARSGVNMHPLIVSDINNDHHDDILLPGINKVLLNDGRANFTTVPLIVEDNFMTPNEVGLIADFNGDGRPDFITVPGTGPLARMLVLYSGNGSVPFSSAPIPVWAAQRSSFAAYKLDAPSVITAGDIDRDGDLDLFVAQYKPPYVGGQVPTPYYDANDGYPSFLLLNDGKGNFELAPPQPGFAAKKYRRTLAASLVDLDGDGDLDLVTLNDFSGVDLFDNDGKGNFTDETARLDNRSLFAMAHAIADFNQDGRFDLLAIGMSIPTVRRLEAMRLQPAEFKDRTAFRKEMAYGNRLYLNQGHGEKWLEPPFGKELTRSGWAWGVAAEDFDNNGFLDIYVANGHVSGASIADYDSHYWTHDIYVGSSSSDRDTERYFNRALRSLNKGETSWNGYQHNAFFLDVATNDYLNVAFLMGIAHETDCRAVVSADFNEDGKPDLVVTAARWMGDPNHMRHELYVHLNQTETSNHWLGVRFPANATNSLIGTKLSVKSGGANYVAQVITGESFQSQRPTTIHFGLGAATSVETLTIIWPNGRSNVLGHPAIDRYHSINP
jgi:hypothetical protein